MVPAGPGGPPGLSADHEAHPGAAGTSDPAPGGSGVCSHGKRPCYRCGAANRRRVPGPGGGALHRHLSAGPHHRGRLCGGLRPRRTPRGGPPDGEPAGPGPAPSPVQDRHAAPGEPAKHRLFQNAAPGGGSVPLALQLRDGASPGKPGRVLADIYHGADPPDHPGKPGQKPPVFRGHPGHRSPVLSVHRDKDCPFPGQGAASAVHRAHGPGHRGNVHPGLFLLSAGGCAAANAAVRPRTGAGGDDASGLRHRI